MWILLEKSRQHFGGSLFIKQEQGGEISLNPFMEWNPIPQNSLFPSHNSLYDQTGTSLAVPFPIFLLRVVELFLFLLHPVLSHGSNSNLVLPNAPIPAFLLR